MTGSAGVVGYWGVGYVISKPVAKLINLFLKAINVKPIAPSAGPRSDNVPLWLEGPSQRCFSRS